MKLFQRITTISLLLALCFSLTGCGKTAETETPTLWIVTEKSNSNGMNQQIEQVIKTFQADHPDFEIQLDILPTEEDERELALQKLRSLLLAGDGPDLLLLPSCDSRVYIQESTMKFDDDKTIFYRGLEQLLPNPVQSMRAGLFLDISEFYDNDKTLGKEALQQTIMDAGTLGDARYILPLRYDFPAVYIWDEGVEALGIEPEDLAEGIIPTLKAALEAGNSQLASGLLPSFCRTGSILALLTDSLDYEAEQVTLDAEELAEFLALYQSAEALAEGNQDGWVAPKIDDYINSDNYEFYKAERGSDKYRIISGDAYPYTIPAAVATFSQAFQAAAIAKAESGESFQMLPLPASDGKLTAWVTYYGAITAGCDYPEEAYDFLRRFLLEENQWEQNRPLDEDRVDGSTWRYNLVEDGWPVRYKGFIADIWPNIRNDYGTGLRPTNEETARVGKIRKESLTDADIPLLDAEIDRVYFGNSLEQELAEAIRGLNDEETGEAITTDLDALAEEFVKELKYQLLEG